MKLIFYFHYLHAKLTSGVDFTGFFSCYILAQSALFLYHNGYSYPLIKLICLFLVVVHVVFCLLRPQLTSGVDFNVMCFFPCYVTGLVSPTFLDVPEGFLQDLVTSLRPVLLLLQFLQLDGHAAHVGQGVILQPDSNTQNQKSFISISKICVYKNKHFFLKGQKYLFFIFEGHDSFGFEFVV